jgi:hypothetical protein
MDEQDQNHVQNSRNSFNNHNDQDMNNKYVDSEPIQEYVREEEMTATPHNQHQYEEMIRQRCKLNCS